MRTLKLVVAYDGTAYQGWQRQASGPTVQAALEEAFEPLVAEVPTVTGAGRTDAGVHALAQVASVRITSAHPVDAIRRALNARLPPDVRVTRVSEAAEAFHARFDAVSKLYRYRVVTADHASPFDRWFVWHAPGRFDLDAMRDAAACVLGRRDFRSFQAAGTEVEDTVRTVTAVSITALADGFAVEVEGEGFLRHMVRILVGTLIDVGAGRRPASALPALLAGCDRRLAGDTAPAQGLTLVSVRYPG